MGKWEKVCDYKGWDFWILNEGRISEDEWVTFDDTFEKENEFDMTVLNSTKETLLKIYEEFNSFVEDDTERSGACMFLNGAKISLSRAIERVDDAINEYS